MTCRGRRSPGGPGRVGRPVSSRGRRRLSRCRSRSKLTALGLPRIRSVVVVIASLETRQRGEVDDDRCWFSCARNGYRSKMVVRRVVPVLTVSELEPTVRLFTEIMCFEWS